MKKYYPRIINPPINLVAICEQISSETKALEKLEQEAKMDNLQALPLLASKEWESFSSEVRTIFLSRDHLIVKGWPIDDHGASLILAALSVGQKFRTYRNGQVVKKFKMSPWTRELSHTTLEGEFHSDLNTEILPPEITAILCLEPDPGGPVFGMNRIARLEDLLDYLEEYRQVETLDFLMRESVTMLNDRAASSWTGQMVMGSFIRYHPETIRAAARRSGQPIGILEDRISQVSKAAFAVSEPFYLDRGDVLILSNHKTLHYRGQCSVVFEGFPLKFRSRSIAILHASQEIKMS